MSRHPLAEWKNAIRDSALDSSAKLVAHTIGTYLRSGTESAYPSVPTIATGASLARKTVDRALCRLEAEGWLRIERVRGGRMTHRYHALIPPSYPQPPTGQPVPPEQGTHYPVTASVTGQLTTANRAIGDANRATEARNRATSTGESLKALKRKPVERVKTTTTTAGNENSHKSNTEDPRYPSELTRLSDVFTLPATVTEALEQELDDGSTGESAATGIDDDIPF